MIIEFTIKRNNATISRFVDAYETKDQDTNSSSMREVWND